MTITDEELRRFDALLCNGPLSRERGRDLVAELRQLTVQRSAYRAEADALRAENERLRGELRYEAITDRATLGAERDAARLTSEELARANLAMARERDALRTEAAELRASLADAVAKIAAMEPVVEAARAWHHEPAGADTRFVFALTSAVADYEAALPGIVKVGP